MSNVDPLPTSPSRANPDTFAALTDAFLAALSTFRTQMNVVGDEAAQASAAAIAAQAIAQAAANAAAISAGVPAWVSGTTYTRGTVVYSPITLQSYRRKTNGAGTTDPSGDSTNWQPISADLTAGPTITSPTITGGATVTGGMSVSGASTISGALTLSGALRLHAVDLGEGSEIDVSIANHFSKTITAGTLFSVTGAPAANTVASFVLSLTNGGSAAVDWWSGLTWEGGVAPALTASGLDVFGFFSLDGGSTWIGTRLGEDFA